MSTFQSLYALPRRYMEMGITNAPIPISVAARFIRRYVLRLRKVGLVKKTTMVKVFSVMMKSASATNSEHHAYPSSLLIFVVTSGVVLFVDAIFPYP